MVVRHTRSRHRRGDGEVPDPSGATERFPVEPLANYFVGRARREWRGGQTYFGSILTSVHRDLTIAPQEAALHRAAYAGGADFRHEFANRRWAINGDMELSRVEGTTSAIIATQRRSNHFFQRPDADHLEVDSSATSLNGYSANLRLTKQGGAHWRGFVGSAFTSPTYEVNDLGFAVRTDRRRLRRRRDVPRESAGIDVAPLAGERQGAPNGTTTGSRSSTLSPLMASPRHSATGASRRTRSTSSRRMTTA